MDAVDPNEAFQFYNQTLRNSASSDAIDIEDMVTITETQVRNDNPQADPEGECITLSLLDTHSGDTHKKSGLNWGQIELGPAGRKKPYQAYIPVPSAVQLSDFFPNRGEQFTVLTDDGNSFIFVRAQAGGKALHTTLDNSQLGKYIRSRLGVRSGQYVTRQHLAEYGRTDITFTKIDEETYILDFRPNFGPGEDAELWQE